MSLNEAKDIWAMKCDWLCVTTNGVLNSRGRAVMGKGIALAAKTKIPGCDFELGKQIAKHGNHVFEIGKFTKTVRVFSFPTKHDWRNKSDLKLIEQSCKELLLKWDEATFKDGKKFTVVLPRVGCSNGGLDYQTQVKPLLTKYFGTAQYREWFIICA
jgi:hypothetical protein